MSDQLKFGTGPGDDEREAALTMEELGRRQWPGQGKIGKWPWIMLAAIVLGWWGVLRYLW